MSSFLPTHHDDNESDLHLKDDIDITFSNPSNSPSLTENDEDLNSSIQRIKNFIFPTESLIENNGNDSSSYCDKSVSSFKEGDLDGYISRIKHFMSSSNSDNQNIDKNGQNSSFFNDHSESGKNSENASKERDYSSEHSDGSLSESVTENLDVNSISSRDIICDTEQCIDHESELPVQWTAEFGNVEKYEPSKENGPNTCDSGIISITDSTHSSLPIFNTQNENIKEMVDFSLQTASTYPSCTGVSSCDSNLAKFALFCPIKFNPKHTRFLHRTFSRFVSKNVSKFPFGARWTLVTTFLVINAVVLSFLCKHSSKFVTLRNPMFIGASFKPVTKIGLFRFKLCLSMSVINTDAEMGVKTLAIQPWLSDEEAFHNFDLIDMFGLSQFDRHKSYSELSKRLDHHNHTFSPANFNSFEGDNDAICSIITLNSEMIGNNMWKIAHIFSAWTTGAGFLITLTVICMSFWKALNLVLISAMLFALYLCQCLSLFFFDSELCHRHGCSIAEGTIYCIISTFYWFASGVSVLKTLQVKRVKETERRKSRLKERRRQKLFQREQELKFLQLESKAASFSDSISFSDNFETESSSQIQDCVVSNTCRQLTCPKSNRKHYSQ